MIRFKEIIFLLTLSISCVLFSCGEDTKNGKKSSSTLPSAKGNPGELVLVMDSAQWAGQLGEDLYYNVLGRPVKGILKDEPMFSVSNVRPAGFSSILRQARNVMLVISMDSPSADTRRMKKFFSEEALAAVKKDNKAFLQVNKDVYAKGQTLAMLFASSEKVIKEYLHDEKNQQKIIDAFNLSEKKKLTKSLNKTYDKSLYKKLKKDFNISLQLFQGYKVAKQTEDFIWLRHPEVKVDRNIIISLEDYQSQDQFKGENIVKRRDSIAKAHIYGDPANKDSYVVTERLVPVEFQETKIDDRYAVESRGIWKTNNISMGGSFLSYTLTNKEGTKLCYIEGFVVAPGQDKREVLREMEAILNSFK